MRNSSLRFRSIVFIAALAGCAKVAVNSNAPSGGGGATGSGGTGPTTGVTFGGAGGGYTPAPVPCAGAQCTDFPADPIVDMGTPANAASMFSGAPSGAGPCVVEPEDGTLFPRNWLRARVHWTGTTGVTQIQISSPHQDKTLTAYTSSDHWAIPKDIWTAMTGHAQQDETFTVSVRAAGGGATQAKFTIAPVEASGSMIFWAAKPSNVGEDPTAAGAENDSELRGFAIGDESTESVLKIPQVMQPSKDQGGAGRTVKCIGCHAGTPDGQYVGFVDHWPWNAAIAGIKADTIGQKLSGLSTGGLADLNQPWGGMPTFSAMHWTQGDRIMVLPSSLQNPMQPYSTDDMQPAKLVWYNMDAPDPPMVNGQKFPVLGQQFGVIARTGDAGGAACPNWAHTSDTIVYSSTMGGNLDGRLAKGKTDLYTVPYGTGMGGTAMPIMGAAETAWEEYYPAFSPDDKFVAFNRVPSGEVMYANPDAELFIVPSAGGAAKRLVANDPPKCSGMVSPGMNNHWGRWSPQVQPAGGATYYWVIFSSNRAGIPPVKSNPNAQNPNGLIVQVSQLYITGIVVTENDIITTPAIYLWNQPNDTLNTTPAWEAFALPPPPK